VVGVAAEAGAAIAATLAAAADPVRARITTAGVSRHDRCANIVATLGPADATNAIILSAHLDTFDNNPGALDNLTGVLTLVEIARALAPHQPHFRRPLRLVIFTGEEFGFLGSKAYVARHVASLDDVGLVFNMDTLFPATAEGIAVMGSPEMRSYFERQLQFVLHEQRLPAFRA
jgi:Zn-dependent M28 family amino/carboxypeptidase